MSRRTPRSRRVALAALPVLVITSSAAAQGEGVSLDAFRAADLSTDGFALARPVSLLRGTYSARLTLDYGLRPLEFDVSNSTALDYAVVEHQLVGALAIGFAVHDRVTVAASIPLSLVQRGDSPPASTMPGADGRLAGDAAIAGRVRLFGDRDDDFILGANLELTFPLADAADPGQLWSGDQTVTFQPTVLAELRLTDDVRLNATLGGRFRGVARQTYFTAGQEMTYGVGATYEAVEQTLDVVAELYGATDFGVLPGSSNSPLELIAGVMAHPNADWHLGAALGTGLSTGYGAADLRAVLTVGYAPSELEAEVEETPAPPADTDADDDGIEDASDAAPNDAEDVDGFEDDDGRPDADNDADGVLDGADAAPNDAEDADGFEDGDGRPDPDNDADGVLDGADRCPLEAEDADGLADEDGCAETDADTDTILDPDDHCPMTPGAANAAMPECSGCPSSACMDDAGNIRILQRIEFETGSDVIKAESMPVLESVREILRTTTRIRKVLIEGHTDDRGDDAANQELSARRAAAVVRWLAEHGIEAARLDSAGIGEARPVDSNRTAAGRQNNRRVEFHIVDPAPAPGHATTTVVTP